MASLTLNTAFDYSKINNDIDHNLHLMVKLTAPEVLITDEQRPPLNICIGLDISSSMYGKKLEIMKGAAKKFVDNLLPKDRISIIAFNQNVQLITDEPIYATRENKLSLKNKIDDMI